VELWGELKETFMREKSVKYEGNKWGTVYVNARDAELTKNILRIV